MDTVFKLDNATGKETVMAYNGTDWIGEVDRF